MTVYKEPTSSRAFLIRSVENRFAGISKLNADYTNTTGIISHGPRIEGMAMWESDSEFYLIGSHLTGWKANAAVLSGGNRVIKNGTEWKDLGNPTKSPTTFESQSTFVLPVKTPKGTVDIFLADRWNYPQVDLATYIWLPIVKKPTQFDINWYASWRIGDFLVDFP
eukprot:TRINITY_DN22153_c0_g1_i1.p1 TRINITY_DN22153_c0_g1~~TRINITY_DN22153_c0_g1_i1.p1  ORF type:complete len:166 (-),score=21.19 TRINITY_DN22153_c0_g1_i1:28-525(-)